MTRRFKKLFAKNRADAIWQDDPYKNLAVAIVKQAVTDYMYCYKLHLYGWPLGENGKTAKELLENDDEVDYLVGYSGIMILQEIEKEIGKEVESERAKRKKKLCRG